MSALKILLLTLICMLACSPATFAGRKYALVVGVQKYRVNQPLPDLIYTENDATELAKVLRNGGYNVTTMTTATARVPGQEHLAPSSDYIRDQLNTILNAPNLDEDDVVLIAFAGHGVQFDFVEGTGDNQKRSPRFYFCPADAGITDVSTANQITAANNLINLTELYELIDQCHAGGKLLLVDACRNDPSKPALQRLALPVLPALPPPPGGTAAFLSCSSNETSVEDPTLMHGVFFHHVIEALKGEADTATSKKPADGKISIAELQQYVSDSTFDFVNQKYPGKRQTPELKGQVRLTIPVIELPQRTPNVITNSLGMKLVLIPAGEFLMGSPEGETGRSSDEGPQHRVRISKPFYLGETEVTQEQFRAVMNTEPWKGETYAQENGRNAASYISHEDATEFCRRLSQREGKTYRLPREAEWEYACRGGTTTRFHFGDDESRLGEYAWFDGNAESVGEEYAHAVQQKKPNPFGLYDMHGNVWEWCADWYDSEYYASSPGTDPTGPSSGSSRVLRGGSWYSVPNSVRCASRFVDTPDSRYSFNGFRVLSE
ncbi:MAG: Serine/threonine-protein kinase pkn1 [Planctomycetota bacterium]|jgi:formylglycine-generating enzyme required for sulfatase activity